MTMTAVRLDAATLRVSRRSMFTGRLNTMDLPVDQPSWTRYLEGRGSVVIQRLLPDLTPDQREFLISGCTPEEWESVLGPEED